MENSRPLFLMNVYFQHLHSTCVWNHWGLLLISTYSKFPSTLYNLYVRNAVLLCSQLRMGSTAYNKFILQEVRYAENKVSRLGLFLIIKIPSQRLPSAILDSNEAYIRTNYRAVFPWQSISFSNVKPFS